MYPHRLEELLAEVKQDFIRSSKESTVKYIIKKPVLTASLEESLKISKPAPIFTPPKDVFVAPPNWSNIFIETRKKIEMTLFIGHPTFVKLLDMWTHYRDYQFVDLEEILANKTGYNLIQWYNIYFIPNIL